MKKIYLIIVVLPYCGSLFAMNNNGAALNNNPNNNGVVANNNAVQNNGPQAPDNVAPAPRHANDLIEHQLFRNDEHNRLEEERLNQREQNALGLAHNDAERLEVMRRFSDERQGRLTNGAELHRTYRTALLTDRIISKRAAGVLALAALGFFGAKYGTSLFKDMLSQWFSVPPLAQETSLRSWGDKLKSIFIPEPEIEKYELKDVVLNEALTKQVFMLTQAVKMTAHNNSYFRHFLFYGPSGTGKTMLAKAIAHTSGLEYIYFSAAKLELYSIEEGLKQLVHLFEYARSYPKKLVIIIDEAEVLFGKREKLCDKTFKLLDQILTYMGTESQHFMVIAISNKPHFFDEASRNRFGLKIKIGVPAFEERQRLIERYRKKYLSDATQPKPDVRTFWQKIVTTTPEPQVLLTVAQETTQPAFLDDIALRLDGFVGRDISDLMLAVQGAAYVSKDHVVTQKLIYEALETKLGQREEEHNNFGEAAVAA